jgi:excisionase family DNA binding protein
VGEEHSGAGTPSGSDRPSSRNELYTVAEAAKVLGITDRRVRALAQEGRIEGERTEGGWKLFRYSVHSFRDERREREAPSEAARSTVEAREWIERVNTLERELGRLEGRLELTERTESTLREQLERERERADESELEARRLRAALEEARKPERPWWRRVFGG